MQFLHAAMSFLLTELSSTTPQKIYLVEKTSFSKLFAVGNSLAGQLQ
jgi:hypothetical protein